MKISWKPTKDGRKPECFWTKPIALSWIAAHLLIELCFMFVLCLKVWWTVWNVVMPGGCLLGKDDRLPGLLFTLGLSLCMLRRNSVYKLSCRSVRFPLLVTTFYSVCCSLELIKMQEDALKAGVWNLWPSSLARKTVWSDPSGKSKKATQKYRTILHTAMTFFPD